MTRLGMDADAVEAAGRQLQAKAQSLDALVANLDKTVASLNGVWDGKDSQTFVNEWWPQHKKALAAASASVAGLGQSALNNASEQRKASGVTGTSGVSGFSSPGTHVGPAPTSTNDNVGSSSVGTLSPDQATLQAEYNAWRAAGDGKTKPYGWCTSWVEFRRESFSPPLSVPHGNGGEMAPASGANSPPTLGGIVSFPADNTSDFSVGHVAVVESISSTDPRTFTVSEMNAGADAVHDINAAYGNGEVVVGRTFTQVAGGWEDSNGVLWPELHFLS